MIKKYFRLVAFILLALVQSFFLLQFVGYNKNTLSKKKDWASVKLIQQLATTGSAHYLLTRNGLHQNQLHLGAWHGYQFLAPTQRYNPEEISFDFYLPSSGVLYFLFNIKNRQMMGLKLAAPSAGLSFFFEGSIHEGFQSQNYTDLLLTNGWHNFTIKNSNNDQSEVFLDGAKSDFPFPALIEEQFVALHGGVEDVIIDNFQINNKNGMALSEDFSYDWPWWLIIFLFLLCLSSQIFIGGSFRNQSKIVAFRLLLYNITFYLSLTPIFIYDYYHWSKGYHYNTYVPFGEKSLQKEKDYESWRQWFFSETIAPQNIKSDLYQTLSETFVGEFTDWDGKTHFAADVITQINGDKNVEVSHIPKKDFSAVAKKQNEFRIGFLGSSQTFGKGASRMDQTMVVQFHKDLVSQGLNKEIVTYNFSEAGLTLSGLFSENKDSIEQAQLDVLITNAGFNDSDPEIFRKNILLIERHFSKRNIRTIFLSEPSSEHSTSFTHRYNLLVLQNLANMSAIEHLDLNEYMLSQKDSGLLWWDNVHMTSFGQKKAADWLSKELRPLINKANISLKRKHKNEFTSN